MSEISGTLSSTKLAENSSEEEWVDSVYFSGNGLMARMKKMVRFEEEPRTSGAVGHSGGSEVQNMESQPREEKKSGEMVKREFYNDGRKEEKMGPRNHSG